MKRVSIGGGSRTEEGQGRVPVTSVLVNPTWYYLLISFHSPPLPHYATRYTLLPTPPGRQQGGRGAGSLYIVGLALQQVIGPQISFSRQVVWYFFLHFVARRSYTFSRYSEIWHTTKHNSVLDANAEGMTSKMGFRPVCIRNRGNKYIKPSYLLNL